VLGAGFEGFVAEPINLQGVKAYWSSLRADVPEESFAVVVGDAGVILTSTDMGASWVQKPTCSAQTFFDVHFTMRVTPAGANNFSASLEGAKQ
jgi:photosystem II stability/assembly factor-like uncharacterized protein